MVEGKPSQKWRGAEIIADEDACDAARSLTHATRYRGAERRVWRGRRESDYE